jgi:hypothetical protein
MISHISNIEFPEFGAIRCLMMPYIQGDSSSLPDEYSAYSEIVDKLFIKEGDIGYLTIDESFVLQGTPHRGSRAKTERAIHTEVGRRPGKIYAWGWGGGRWGRSHRVILDRDVQILLANNIDCSCALWDAEHENTSSDGDLGSVSNMYPYENAIFMKNGEVYHIGILTPHESIPLPVSTARQFLRIISSGVHGREPYFTKNRLMD